MFSRICLHSSLKNWSPGSSWAKHWPADLGNLGSRVRYLLEAEIFTTIQYSRRHVSINRVAPRLPTTNSRRECDILAWENRGRDVGLAWRGVARRGRGAERRGWCRLVHDVIGNGVREAAFIGVKKINAYRTQKLQTAVSLHNYATGSDCMCICVQLSE